MLSVQICSGFAWYSMVTCWPFLTHPVHVQHSPHTKQSHGNPLFYRSKKSAQDWQVGVGQQGLWPALTWTCWDVLRCAERTALSCQCVSWQSINIAKHCVWNEGENSGKVTLHPPFGDEGFYDNGNVWNVRASKKHLLFIESPWPEKHVFPTAPFKIKSCPNAPWLMIHSLPGACFAQAWPAWGTTSCRIDLSIAAETRAVQARYALPLHRFSQILIPASSTMSQLPSSALK